MNLRRYGGLLFVLALIAVVAAILLSWVVF